MPGFAMASQSCAGRRHGSEQGGVGHAVGTHLQPILRYFPGSPQDRFIDIFVNPLVTAVSAPGERSLISLLSRPSTPRSEPAGNTPANQPAASPPSTDGTQVPALRIHSYLHRAHAAVLNLASDIPGQSGFPARPRRYPGPVPPWEHPQRRVMGAHGNSCERGTGSPRACPGRVGFTSLRLGVAVLGREASPGAAGRCWWRSLMVLWARSLAHS